jgi:hypothetical protein
MPADSRSKNGVASLAYVAGIHVLMQCPKAKTWMAGTSPAMTALKHDPEKWKPVFRKDHAQSKC